MQAGVGLARTIVLRRPHPPSPAFSAHAIAYGESYHESIKKTFCSISKKIFSKKIFWLEWGLLGLSSIRRPHPPSPAFSSHAIAFGESYHESIKKTFCSISKKIFSKKKSFGWSGACSDYRPSAAPTLPALTPSAKFTTRLSNKCCRLRRNTLLFN